VQRDRMSGVAFLVIGLGTGLAAANMSVGTLKQPGPGLWPFVLSVALVGLAATQLATAPASGAGGSAGSTSVHVWLTVGDLAAYSLLVEQLGFIVTTALFLAFQLRIVEREGWRTVVGVAVLATAASYVVFGWILGVQLPSGLLLLRPGP